MENNSWSLVGTIDDYFARKFEELKKAGTSINFHVSDMGYCLRQRMYKHKQTTPSNPYTSRVIRTFEVGNAFHEWLEKLCQEAGVLIEKEGKLFNEKYQLSGRFDLLVEKNGKKILYDLKTQHSFSFSYLKRGERNKAHDKQVQTYLYMLKDKQKDVEGRLLYIDRDNLMFYEIPIPYNEEVEKEIIAELDELKKWSSSPELPPQIAELDENGKQNWQCKWCPFLNLCRGENWVKKVTYGYKKK